MLGAMAVAKLMLHYTDKEGWNGIRSTTTWRFRASKPPGPHPYGAYFTNLDEATPYLAAKLCIPRRELAFSFAFGDAGDLKQLDGGRGQYVFSSVEDYLVEESRQVRHGETSL
jgi:hypothetical protein